MGVVYEGIGGYEGATMVKLGGQAEGGLFLPLEHRQWCCILSKWQICTKSTWYIDWDGHWWQFGTPLILISVPQWLYRSCNAPMQYCRVGKKLSVKADRTIYSHIVDVSGDCMSVSLILGISVLVTIWSDFVNPVTHTHTHTHTHARTDTHIYYAYTHTHTYNYLCMYVCTHVCKPWCKQPNANHWPWVPVCMYVCMYIYVQTYVRVYNAYVYQFVL